MVEEEESLEDFKKKSYPDMLHKMARWIDPSTSKKIERKGLGKLIDVAILLRRGFAQMWQFVIVIQALFIFLGLSSQVSDALAQLGIHISGFWLGVIAVGGIVFFFIFGLAMLLYGGSQRSKFLINAQQNPNPRLDYHYYRASAKKLEEMDERLKRLEEKVGE